MCSLLNEPGDMSESPGNVAERTVDPQSRTSDELIVCLSNDRDDPRHGLYGYADGLASLVSDQHFLDHHTFLSRHFCSISEIRKSLSYILYCYTPALRL